MRDVNPDSAAPLRRALIVNACFSITSAVILLSCAAGLADRMGAGVPFIYRAVGLSLVAFGGGITFLIRQKVPNPKIASLVSFADLGWVVGSIVLLVVGGDWFTRFGVIAITAVALVVLAVAVAQLWGIQKVRETLRSDTSTDTDLDTRKVPGTFSRPF